MSNERIKQEDTYIHKAWRQKLVDELKQKGITDRNVLQAINTVPRHFFFDIAFQKIAYEDKPFPIDEDQTISRPYTVAYQTELLQIKKFDSVLEIGTGSVYQSSILAEMGARVFTIERQRKLYDRTQTHYPLKKKYFTIKFFYGDGFLGLPTYAPFDKILITAASPFVPQTLIEQLKPNGIMVLPIGEEEQTQIMTRIIKREDGTMLTESLDPCTFVPMLPGKNE